uniref:Uncharacterized protein n=1 Tax=Magallana gigas TaxID=29159 RepID=K1QBJ0_MAGGI
MVRVKIIDIYVLESQIMFPCCTNFYWDEGECKACLPGYFGMNCQTSCVYPTFGKLCMNTCDCNISDCDHVSGCQENDTEITAVNTRSWVSLSVNPNFPLSYSSAATPDYSTEKEKLYNDQGAPREFYRYCGKNVVKNIE